MEQTDSRKIFSNSRKNLSGFADLSINILGFFMMHKHYLCDIFDEKCVKGVNILF